jgi:hypothetical protein
MTDNDKENYILIPPLKTNKWKRHVQMFHSFIEMGYEFQAIQLNEFIFILCLAVCATEPVRLQKTYNYHIYSNSKNHFESFLKNNGL